MIVEILKASPDHVAAIAADCRKEDADEFYALNRATPRQVLDLGLKTATVAYTGFVDRVPVCMFGVSPYSFLAGQGIPWMVSCNGLKNRRLQRAIMMASSAVVEDFKSLFPSLLFNQVDDRNESAKKWLGWLGFVLLDPVPMGPDGVLFRPFYWSEHHA